MMWPWQKAQVIQATEGQERNNFLPDSDKMMTIKQLLQGDPNYGDIFQDVTKSNDMRLLGWFYQHCILKHDYVVSEANIDMFVNHHLQRAQSAQADDREDDSYWFVYMLCQAVGLIHESVLQKAMAYNRLDLVKVMGPYCPSYPDNLSENDDS